jgi:hypothetical protein
MQSIVVEINVGKTFDRTTMTRDSFYLCNHSSWGNESPAGGRKQAQKMVDDDGPRQRNENDDAAPRGIPNLSGVACHINSVLLLMAHCGLPLHPLAARHGGILKTWLARLRSASSSSSSDGSDDGDGPDPPLLPPIEECYGVLRASFGIEVEEVGDPVIALRKLLDMQHPALSGGNLQTTLVQQTNQAALLPVVRRQLVQQPQDKNGQLDDDTDHPISSFSTRKTRQLKPSRMPNPLPLPNHTALADLFRTRILSNEPVPDYQWPVCDGSQEKEVVAKTASMMDGVAAVVGGETNQSMTTMRTRRIVAFPDVFMAHLPASSPRQQRRCRALEDQSTRHSGNDDDTGPPLSSSSSSLANHAGVVPMRIESSSSTTTTTGEGDDDKDIVFELVGAILHIANTDDDNEYDDDEAGHTATLIQWTTTTTTTTSSSDEGGNGETEQQYHRVPVWYLIDDEVVYQLAPGDAQALLEQGGPYPPMSSSTSVSSTKHHDDDDDEAAVAFCFPVLLVYRRSEMSR